VRFDELILKIPDDEIRVKFHPRMTVLSGLGAPERQAMANTIVGALTGGSEETALRCIDGAGRTVIVLNGGGGPVRARHDDDGSGAAPVGDLMTSPDALRELILVHAAEIGVVARAARPDEPRELREARASLEEITTQLQKALGEEQQAATIQAQIDAIDEQLRTAEDGEARREYAKVLAQLEAVQSEAATLQAGPDEIAADQKLLTHADAIQALAARWTEAAERLAAAIDHFGGAELLHGEDLERAAALPTSVADDLDGLVEEVTTAEALHAELDQRLQGLTVGKLPAVSEAAIGELGLLEPSVLWGAANRVIAARDGVTEIQVALGGLGAGPGGAAPLEIEAMEEAHRAFDAAEQSAESVRVVGVAGTGFGLSVALAGTVGSAMFIPLGMLISAVVGTVTLLLPRRRVAQAAAAERAALDRTGAPTYLGFHLRRVDASMDPTVRKTVGAAATELRVATTEWTELVGPGIDVDHAKEMEAEVCAYHAALCELGSTAQEIEELRADLAERALPAVAAARTALADACGALGLTAADIADPSSVMALVTEELRRGAVARSQIELERAEGREQELARDLQAKLAALGFDSGPLDARVSALGPALAGAAQRAEARARSRSAAEIAEEQEALQARVDEMRRPEWDTVTADEAAAPDVDELEDRRTELLCALAEERPSVDVSRLSDRRAALERRVSSLEAKYGDDNAASDPGTVVDIQQHLVARLGRAAKAGPHGDAVPALLDEVLARVPVDRKWDLLDHLYRLSESHQIVYLSDDPFVAAWARQRAEGSLSLLEPEPEPV